MATRAARAGTDETLATPPNPFSTQTTITFRPLAQRQQGAIEVYDLRGRLVRSLSVSGNQEGSVAVSWRGLTAGCTPYRLLVDGARGTTKRFVANP